MEALTRDQVLAYRWAVHRGDAVLGTGVRDNPPGRTAGLALRARGVPAGDAVLAHTARGAIHLHRPGDLALYAAALHVDDPGDLAPAQHGTFPAELADQGLTYGWALDHVAGAMAAVAADGAPRTKGELSGALIDRVDGRLRPWCEGCGVFHVHDALFRWATLQAGLVVAEGRYVKAGAVVGSESPGERPDPVTARRAVALRFLHLHGPARPAHLAGWLALSPAGARRLWPGDLVEVAVDGRRSWAAPRDLDLLRSAPAPAGVALFPPYDPLTELGDRELLAPDPALRKRVWRPAQNPGIVVAGGEIAGVWRQRGGSVHVEPFRPLPEAEVRAARERLGFA